ncbi:MAG: hypothetical protein WCX65_16370, partial [bacterium]
AGAAAGCAFEVVQHENGKNDNPLVPVPAGHPQKIVFVSNRNSSKNQIFSMNADGSELITIGTSLTGPDPSAYPIFSFSSPAVSQDGLNVYFTSDWYSTSTQIVSVNINGLHYKKINIDKSQFNNDVNLENPRVAWDNSKLAFSGYTESTAPIVAIKPKYAHVTTASNNKPEEKAQFGLSKSGRQILSKDSTKTKGMIEKTGATCPASGYSLNAISFATSDTATATVSPIGKTYCINTDDTNFIELTVTAHHYEKNSATTNIPGTISFTWKWVQNPAFVPLGDDNVSGHVVNLSGQITSSSAMGEGYNFLQKNIVYRKYNLYTSKIDGSNVVVRTNSDDPDRYPCFGPGNSNVLYYVSGVLDPYYMDYDMPENSNLYKLDLNTNTRTQITTNGNNKGCAISPSGNLLAYSHYNGLNYDIYLYDLAADAPIAAPIIATVGDDLYPVFSPAGNKIAFQSDLMDVNPDIFVADINGGNMHNLTRNYSINDLMPAWAP